MSTINVTNLRGKGGTSPNLPDGAVITGVVTATSFSGSGANLTGVANTDFVVGTAITMAVGNIANVNFTKSASGAGATVGSYTGVTTYYGDGSSLTGAGDSIAPHYYNPDVGDTSLMLDSLSTIGIGITFNKKVAQGSSGTATLKIVNAGVAGTTIQSWGLSSTSYDITAFNLDPLVSNLALNQTYQVDIPEGFIVDSAGTSYAGTAYTFTATAAIGKLWTWGDNANGELGINAAGTADKSSPVQVPGTNWTSLAQGGNKTNNYGYAAINSNGELFGWGYNYNGRLLETNLGVSVSSPIQIPGTWKAASNSYGTIMASKADGTLWSWGYNYFGQLGQNQTSSSGSNSYSSPVQIPGTNWNGAKNTFFSGRISSFAIKTNGQLWAWGQNTKGKLGQNQNDVHYSSPTQIPGTTWAKVSSGQDFTAAIKTDGTLWVWGYGNYGELAQNSRTHYSSPVQVPGTTWKQTSQGGMNMAAVKTDGTLWSWGYNQQGQLGDNSRTLRSSPVQVPGTTWNNVECGYNYVIANKTDGTLWSWGYNNVGYLGLNNRTLYSSPVQIGSDTEWTGDVGTGDYSSFAIQEDETP